MIFSLLELMGERDQMEEASRESKRVEYVQDFKHTCYYFSNAFFPIYAFKVANHEVRVALMNETTEQVNSLAISLY